jgi:dolichol-phosphate mannosyltransferase
MSVINIINKNSTWHSRCLSLYCCEIRSYQACNAAFSNSFLFQLLTGLPNGGSVCIFHEPQFYRLLCPDRKRIAMRKIRSKATRKEGDGDVHRYVDEPDDAVYAVMAYMRLRSKVFLYNLPIRHYMVAMHGQGKDMTCGNDQIKISVIIPMFNEAENAPDTIARVEKILLGMGEPFEIIPVNDGSTDNTLKLLDGIASCNEHVRVVSYWKNGGRGKALRHGFKAARGRYIASIDADLSYDPAYIAQMAQALDEDRDIDVVLVSPYMPGGKTVGVPRERLFVSWMGNKVLQMALPEKIHTITCVVRCYRSEVISSLDLESNGKEIHLEILSKLLAMGYKIKEIPAVLTCRKKGESKFSFKSTAVSHLLFTIFERPALLFGFIGMILTLIGLGLGAYILILYSSGTLNPNRPLTTLMTLFILGGIQILSFGFLASQIHYLRKEVLLNRKALAHLKRSAKPEDTSEDEVPDKRNIKDKDQSAKAAS